ncbi:MAG: FHA domain-containing protein, partial [Firmicutes bacterium]|nr:FHA domain-containing protein [Bacillota bacterium]
MIGRSSESLPLRDQTISRRHAEMTPNEGRWYIRDLQSSNGTFVNGTRVTNSRILRPGDQIRTGTTLMLFGEDEEKKRRDLVKVVGKEEMEVSLEHTVQSSDDSMIMAVPEPSQAAQLQLQVLYELTGLIGSITDRDELLEKVMDVVYEYFQADRGFILLLDTPDAPPEPVVVRHRLGEKQKKTGPITVSKTIIRYVMQKAVGVLTSNAMTDQRFASGDSVQAYGIHSAMCVPIKFKDKLYGVVHLDSRIANYTYTEDQLTLLTSIGVQTGLAMAYLTLVDERLRAERLAAVGQTVASLSHSIKNIVQGLRGGAEVVELGMRKDNMRVVKGGWEIVARNLDRVSELAM